MYSRLLNTIMLTYDHVSHLHNLEDWEITKIVYIIWYYYINGVSIFKRLEKL